LLAAAVARSLPRTRLMRMTVSVGEVAFVNKVAAQVRQVGHGQGGLLGQTFDARHAGIGAEWHFLGVTKGSDGAQDQNGQTQIAIRPTSHEALPLVGSSTVSEYAHSSHEAPLLSAKWNLRNA
jgi:hypothetical protein